MYVQHPVVDDAQAGFYRILPLASYRHIGQYAIVRLDYDLLDVSLSLDVYASSHCRIDDNSPADTDRLRKAFPVYAQIPVVRYRLVGSSAMGGFAGRGCVSLQLR